MQLTSPENHKQQFISDIKQTQPRNYTTVARS